MSNYKESFKFTAENYTYNKYTDEDLRSKQMFYLLQDKFRNFEIKWVSWLTTKYKDFIESRFQESKEYIKRTWKTDRLKKQTDKSIRDWIIWELLFAYCMKWIISTQVYAEFDVSVNYVPFDVKTKATKYSTLSKIKASKYNKTYLLADQCKENIFYTFCYLDYENDRACFIMNKDLIWDNIKQKFYPRDENPPFTDETIEIQFNHIIPMWEFIY